ncbi:F-box/WD repeat-containing protein 8 [Gadus morhua]|uniref:F-box and WD repeat domain containing 8 n=1 Tax=Gadus morhua TaxID=8049 RepID=A0A8C4ZNM9_GADMO|nr:F-box/WD repeat-containing protein 8 [Gadus morhua]
MADDELLAFRKSWKRELTDKNEDKTQTVRIETAICSKSKSTSTLNQGGEGDAKCVAESNDEPKYVSIASGLLDGRTSPLLERIQEERTRRKRQYHRTTDTYRVSSQHPQKKASKGEKLVDLLIQDLNELNDIPFFDIELPYELALKIFQYLDFAELGRCAQVSKAWAQLAEDGVLWYRLCLKAGYQLDASVCDSPCWKSTLRDCLSSHNTVRSNWKSRVGSIVQLQYELGKVLCDVSSCDNFVLAGYTSGDVRLWDTLHWDASASYLKANSLSANTEPRPQVTHVQVSSTLAAAAYQDGCVDVWSTQTGGQPIHHYQSAGGGLQALTLSTDSSTLASASGRRVRLDHCDDHGYWRSGCSSQLPQPVDSLLLVPDRPPGRPLAAAVAGDSVYLLDPREAVEPHVLHSVYGHPVTCLAASSSQLALGVKSSGWAMHDGGNKIQVYSLETRQSVVRVGTSEGDFTCIHLSHPHLLACGNKDRRVRLFDLRSGSSVVSLYAHHLGVTAVQADDWKIVSGGDEGLVCVWDSRAGAKLWEMHNRHPVRHVRFQGSMLVTANIPDEKTPRGACITDDDLTAHRRHRGVISRYDFSEDATAQDHILPICRSNYAESHGYNYNIGLAVPYDTLRGAYPAY